MSRGAIDIGKDLSSYRGSRVTSLCRDLGLTALEVSELAGRCSRRRKVISEQPMDGKSVDMSCHSSYGVISPGELR